MVVEDVQDAGAFRQDFERKSGAREGSSSHNQSNWTGWHEQGWQSRVESLRAGSMVASHTKDWLAFKS